MDRFSNSDLRIVKVKESTDTMSFIPPENNIKHFAVQIVTFLSF